MSSLDEFTRRKLIEFEGLLTTVNQLLQEDIKLVSAEAQNIIKTAAREVGVLAAELSESLKDVIIVAGNTAVYVVDRATYNTILIISVILLGIGLLVFAWMLFTKKLPQNMFARVCAIIFIFAFLGIFGCLTFLPETRAYALDAMGGPVSKVETTAKTPKILFVEPDVITIGETKEIKVRGINLQAEGFPPRVYLGEIELPVKAYDDNTIVLNVEKLVPNNNRTYIRFSTDISGQSATPAKLFIRKASGGLDYLGSFGKLPVLTVDRIPVVINNSQTVPVSNVRERSLPLQPSPTVTSGSGNINNIFKLIDPNIINRLKLLPTGKSVTEGSYSLVFYYGEAAVGAKVVNVVIPPPPVKPADLVITNVTFNPAQPDENENISITVEVKNIGESAAGKFLVEWQPSPFLSGKSQTVNGLAPGATARVNLTYRYNKNEVYQTVATVDAMNQVNESNEENNTYTKKIQVTIPRYRVKVVIYKLYVKNDMDGSLRGAGDLWFNFAINGYSYRYPSSGLVSINSGETKDIWIEKTLLLTSDDILRIIVTGKEDDDFRTEDMGLVDVKYSAVNNFGHGDRSTQSSPYNYKIYYRITTEKL